MATYEHTATRRGAAFLWGGIALGLLLLTGLLTKGFGLAAPGSPVEEAPGLLRRGNEIIVPDGSPLRARLTVTPAAAELTRSRWVLPGIVEADPARTAAVLTPLGGRIVKLEVALGDRVSRGQVLAVIDAPDLAQAYDDNDKAADTFELTAKTLARQEGQLKIGAASDHDLDQARSDHAQAAAEYARTRARLETLGASADPAKRSRLLIVSAPIAGSVTALSVAPGEMINDPTQPMMTVADLSTVWVTALVPEKDIGGVSVGDDAEVSLDAYPHESLHGKVSFVSDVLEPDSRRDKVRIAFPNPRHALKPNMFATVTLLGPPERRVVLPTSALLMNNDRTSVFVAIAPWTFMRRTVVPRLEEGTAVTIDSGVEPGESVVVRGGILLND
jgi:membrane fusion protein, heavy metal efflux system